MTSRRQRRDISALGLLALAIFLLASLVPVGVIGERGATWFPSDNVMGVVGGATRRGLIGFLGGSAFLAPVLVALAGLKVGDWISTRRALRFSLLVGGLMMVLPMGSAGIGPWGSRSGCLGRVDRPSADYRARVARSRPPDHSGTGRSFGGYGRVEPDSLARPGHGPREWSDGRGGTETGRGRERA